MFQDKTGKGLVDDTSKVAENIKLADIGLKSFAERLAASVTNVSKVIEEVGGYNTKAANEVRKTIGQTRVVSDEVQRIAAQAAKQTLLIGVTVEDNIKLYGALNASMQRGTYFTNKQIESFQVLGVTANMSATELGGMAESFDTLGYTTDQTLEMMGKMTQQARSYGLNVGTFMSGVGKNLKLMASYNFKGGVDGLSDMVAQAQSLRIDMSTAVSLADSLMSPDKAIETAAGFQMLGGAIGKLGDPFQLLHMAQTDVAGLQDSLVDMSAAAVQFNKEDGTFDIPVTEMYRLREAAGLAGMKYEQMTEMAMKAAQKTAKLDILANLNTVPEEQKELIANMSKIGANGNLEITMPNGVTKKIGDGFNQLVASDYNTLKELQTKNNMSEMDVAKTSMGYLNQIANAQAVITNMTRLQLASGNGFTDIAEKITKTNDNVLNAFKGDGPNGEPGGGNKMEKNLKIPQEILDATTYLTTQLNISTEQANEFANTTYEFIETIFEEAEKAIKILLKKMDFESIIDNLKENFPTLPSNNEKGPRDNPSGGVQHIDSERGGRDNFSTIDEEKGNRGNLSLNSLTTSSLNINEPTTSAIASNSNLNVSGEVNLKLDNVPTNSSISKDDIAMYLTNNPSAMAAISSQLLNKTGTYGGPVTSGGIPS